MRNLIGAALACTLAITGCAPASDDSTPEAAASTTSDLQEQKLMRELANVPCSVSVSSRPVSVTMELQSQAAPGDESELVVELKIDPLWEVYALGEGDAEQATRLELTLPEGITTDGQWQAPETTTSLRPGGYQVYMGTVAFKRTLAIHPDAAPGTRMIRCDVKFQACDERQCMRPQRIQLELSLQIVAD